MLSMKRYLKQLEHNTQSHQELSQEAIQGLNERKQALKGEISEKDVVIKGMIDRLRLLLLIVEKLNIDEW